MSIITPACVKTICLLEQASSLFDFLLGLNICFGKCHSKLLITLSFFFPEHTVQDTMYVRENVLGVK